MASKPTQRTLAALRKDGYLCAIVEHWNQFSRRRIDLLGFIDLLALGEGKTIGVQCTSGSNVAARRTKILTECRDNARAWLLAGNRIEVWGWSKKSSNGRGSRKTWQPVMRSVVLEDFEPATNSRTSA